MALLAGGGVNQDRIFVSRSGVVLLDGATSIRPQKRYDGGWYADMLGERLAPLTAGRSLADLLADAIAGVVAAADLVADAPSCTVAMVRWGDDRLDVLVLGDSPVVVFRADGSVEVVYDDRLDRVDVETQRDYRDRLSRGFGFDDGHRRLLGRLQHRQRAARNRPAGYWIASGAPQAGHEGVVRSWAVDEVDAVLAVSDGVSCAVTDYGLSWAELRHAAHQGCAAALARIHEIEATDPDGRRWPRAKRHDDKAVALVSLR